MEDEKIVTIQLKLTRNKVLIMLAAFFLCWHPKSLGSETLTLTTYYPAPYGGYSNLLTTGKTLLARDSTLAGASETATVGLGLTSPAVKLHVTALTNEIARFNAALANSYIRVDAASSQSALADKSVGSYTNNEFYLKTNNQEKVRIETTGRVAIGLPPTTWAPTELLHVKSGNIKIETGNLIVGNPPVAASGSGFISGLCKLQSFSQGADQSCPGTYERIVAVYGNSCGSGGAVLTVGTDMHIQSNWVPDMVPNCSGQMLCCNIKADGN